jgi:hypothetical protein
MATVPHEHCCLSLTCHSRTWTCYAADCLMHPVLTTGAVCDPLSYGGHEVFNAQLAPNCLNAFRYGNSRFAPRKTASSLLSGLRRL